MPGAQPNQRVMLQFESALVALGSQDPYMSSLSKMKAIADSNSGFTANPSPRGLTKSLVMPSTTAGLLLLGSTEPVCSFLQPSDAK